MAWRGNEKNIHFGCGADGDRPDFLLPDRYDGGNFTVPAQRPQGVQCAGCLDNWDGKGQFVDMIWEASP